MWNELTFIQCSEEAKRHLGLSKHELTWAGICVRGYGVKWSTSWMVRLGLRKFITSRGPVS